MLYEKEISEMFEYDGEVDEKVDPIHGKLIGTFQENFWDGNIYEDGYREYVFYQGD